MENILVVTPPRKLSPLTSVVKNLPPKNQGIDSMPLILASKINEKFNASYFPFYYSQYNYVELDYIEIEEVFNQVIPDILVISTDYHISNRTTAYIESTISISKIYKQIFPHGKVIISGKQAIINPEVYFASSDIDVIICQESEDIINDIISSINNINKLKQINNIYFRVDGTGFLSTKREKVEYIVSKLPAPDFELLLPWIKYLTNKTKDQYISFTYRTSFGCVYNCDYCGGIPNWNNYTVRSKEQLRRDLYPLTKERFKNIRLSFFDDELFTYSVTHVKEVAELLAELKIKINGVLTHSYHFNKEVADLLFKFTQTIIFGAENFNDSVLEKLKKNQNSKQLYRAFKLAKSAGLKVRCEFIVGLPFENPKTVIYNINKVYNLVLLDIVDEVIPYILTPHPGTKFEKYSENYGIHIENYDYSSYIEEGGYPTLRTDDLNSSQIYLYYLLIKYFGDKAYQLRKGYINIESNEVGSLIEFEKFFRKLGGGHEETE